MSQENSLPVNKESACNAGDPAWSLGWEYPLEKGMATHSSILDWRIPWTEEPGGLQSMGLQSWTPLSDFHFTSCMPQGTRLDTGCVWWCCVTYAAMAAAPARRELHLQFPWLLAKMLRKLPASQLTSCLPWVQRIVYMVRYSKTASITSRRKSNTIHFLTRIQSTEYLGLKHCLYWNHEQARGRLGSLKAESRQEFVQQVYWGEDPSNH